MYIILFYIVIGCVLAAINLAVLQSKGNNLNNFELCMETLIIIGFYPILLILFIIFFGLDRNRKRRAICREN